MRTVEALDVAESANKPIVDMRNLVNGLSFGKL